ncbi:LCP family protein [Allofournierella sp.]|uniref:LCP family protein n=1 Tax=Allofournierella sp. TaxID=1940256 RepID=UPI002E771C19|nr:LCP family protein [Fournierella sp.]MEE0755983.1 LCP family protein [Fournierella sp.]
MNNSNQHRKLNTSSASHGASGASRTGGASSSAGRKINRSGASSASSSGAARNVYHAPSSAASSSGRTASRPAAASAAHASAPRRRKKKRSVLKTVLISLGCFVGVLAIGLFGLYQWVVRSISPEGGNPTINEIINTPTEYKGDVVNVLVCGIDYEEGRAYSGDGSNDGMTDMIMYVNFDVANHKINMLQIPRDTYPGEEYKHGNTGKINAVALHNDGIGSLMELIHEQYKLPVDYYVTIDMQSLKEIVDLFGGIEVYIPKDISYKGSTLEQGYRNLDGEAAEFFVRNRNYAQADIARLDMQRYFYQGLFARIRTANVWDLAKLAPVALKYVETNIPMDELISMGVSFLQVDSANIMMCKLPTYSAAQRYNDQSHLICDVAKTTDLLNEYFRTYGGPVYELDVPTLATVGESTDPNVQYMGQLDTEAEAGQAAG